MDSLVIKQTNRVIAYDSICFGYIQRQFVNCGQLKTLIWNIHLANKHSEIINQCTVICSIENLTPSFVCLCTESFQTMNCSNSLTSSTATTNLERA